MNPLIDISKCLHILVAEDHPLCAAGTAWVLQDHAVTCNVTQVDTPDRLIEQLRHDDIDLVITDYSMPSARFLDGLQMLRYLNNHFARVPIIVLTMERNPAVLSAIWGIGVCALVSKNSPFGDLIQAVRSAASGRRYVAPLIRDYIGLDTWVSARAQLSPCESEVLRLFSGGLTGNEIAERLRRSKKTVSRQKISGMRKLGVSNDAEFFAYAKMLDTCFNEHVISG